MYLTSYGTAVLGLPRPTMLLLGALGGLVLMAAATTGALWSDRIGRRRTVLVGNVLAAVVGLAVFPVIDTGTVPAVAAGLFAILVVGGIGLGPAAAYLPELFAARYRYTAAGMAYSLAAIVGGAVPPVVATPLQAAYGGLAVGALLAGLGVLGVVCGLALPETRDRSLQVVPVPVPVG